MNRPSISSCFVLLMAAVGPTPADGESALRHWAFRPVEDRPPPAVDDAAWTRNPVDRFVLARLEAAGMRPSGPADRRVLIRRAYLDLIGLPPESAQVEAFVADTRLGAVVRMVERLLDSPHYGERWARHWLDVARYSDGFGTGWDGGDRPSAWRYRDWVVGAFNRDLPYDQFVLQQIAGDLLDVEGSDVATGFLALGPTYTSDGGDPESVAKAKADTLEDRMDTTFRGFMALTIACARCHTHKFDPIPVEDYYSVAGVFQNTREVEAPIVSDEVVKRYNDAQDAIRERDRQLKKWLEDEKKANGGELPEDRKPQLAAKRAELEVLRKSAPPKYPFVHAAADAGSTDMHVALRGDLRKKGELAPRRFLRLVAGEEREHWKKGSGRLQLARAIADRNNPLTSRVLVNRVWKHHFGRALVRSPSNLGLLGEDPTHPALLDWLAARFVESGWSVKSLHRLIMLSATYRQGSRFHAEYDRRDGDNRLLWRMSPRRLEVEVWRDTILSVTGELDSRLGGEPTRTLLDSRRRTLYSVISRNGDRFESDRFLRLFDFPSARISNAGRAVSTVPQQYLFMMNSEFMATRARAFADRLFREAADDGSRVDRAYALLFGRPPLVEERAIALEYLGAAAGDGMPRWHRYAQVLLSSHELLQVQ